MKWILYVEPFSLVLLATEIRIIYIIFNLIPAGIEFVFCEIAHLYFLVGFVDCFARKAGQTLFSVSFTAHIAARVLFACVFSVK